MFHHPNKYSLHKKQCCLKKSYTFVGWAASANGTPVSDFTVTRNAEYYAVFSEIANTYTITWMNYDGTLALETDENVPYGSAPSYNGSEPTKPSTAQYSYSFIGWATSVNQTSPITLTVVTGNATYYPAVLVNLKAAIGLALHLAKFLLTEHLPH